MRRWAAPSLALLLAAPRASALPMPRIFPIIFGSDDRKDLYEVTDETVLKLARGTVALFQAKHVEAKGDGFVLKGGKFDSDGARKLDAGERFYGQPNGAFCSGALIASDVVLTAGHCFTERPCSETKFVFGFALLKKDGDPTALKKEDVYDCSKVLASEVGWDKKDKDKTTRESDWALVKLKAAVSGRDPLKLNRKESKKGDAVMLIGHPHGLPTKVVGGAVVVDDKAVGVFGAHLDGGVGASGGPVINVKTGLIEGILVLGSREHPDFEQLPTDCSYKGDDPFTRELTCPGDPIVVKAKVVDATDTNAARTTRVSTILKEMDDALKAK